MWRRIPTSGVSSRFSRAQICTNYFPLYRMLASWTPGQSAIHDKRLHACRDTAHPLRTSLNSLVVRGDEVCSALFSFHRILTSWVPERSAIRDQRLRVCGDPHFEQLTRCGDGIHDVKSREGLCLYAGNILIYLGQSTLAAQPASLSWFGLARKSLHVVKISIRGAMCDTVTPR